MRARAPGIASQDLTELRRLAARYGLSLELLDRLSLRPSEVTTGTGFSNSKVNEWISNGRLPSIKVDGSVAVLIVDLLEFLEAHRRSGTLQGSGKGGDNPRMRALRMLDEVP